MSKGNSKERVKMIEAFNGKVVLVDQDKEFEYEEKDKQLASMIEVMKNGGSGIISVFSNSHPQIVTKIMELCFNNKYDDASKLLKKYLDFIKLLFIEPNPIPIKEVMNYLGYEVGEYRLPLTKMNINHKRVLINELEDVSK